MSPLTNRTPGFKLRQALPPASKPCADLSSEGVSPPAKTIALAGNPNVGKSTVFNALTGLNQHTGNWPGKTVAGAEGNFRYDGRDHILVDLPGTYSLMANSTEEEIARDFLLRGGADVTIVVCDATCLERNLNLVLQTMEITPKVVVCVNLMDEARKKGISVDLEQLSKRLGVPAAGTSARSGKGLDALLAACTEAKFKPVKVRYLSAIESAADALTPALAVKTGEPRLARWLALRLLERGPVSGEFAGVEIDAELSALIERELVRLEGAGIPRGSLSDRIISCIILTAEDIASETVRERPDSGGRDAKLDRILTGKVTGIPIMLLLLCLVFWLTITGANYPSELLTRVFFWLEERLTALFTLLNAPSWLHGALVLGMYRVLAWVVAVMLPPMAIFFPLFTLLEDFGYLPRVAFNLDHRFKKAKACGKQALTMCMGKICYKQKGPQSAGVSTVIIEIMDKPVKEVLQDVRIIINHVKITIEY